MPGPQSRATSRAHRYRHPEPDLDPITYEFSGELWFWRGPAPWYFITVPEYECRELKAESPEVTYGWGMIPATVRVGATEWRTSLFPKDGRYIIPIKTSVREAEALAEGDIVTVRLNIGR